MLACALMAGCASTPPARVLIGPVSGVSSEQLWGQTLAALESAGYLPELRDPAEGRLLVPSRTFGSRERFLLQLYREGWVQLELESYWGRTHGALATEYLDLAVTLRRALYPAGSP